MSELQEPGEKPSAQSTPVLGWKRRLWRIGRRLVIFYLVLLAMLAFFQRSLIFVPTRVSELRPEDAKLSSSRVQTITLMAHDDLQLNGWHFLARGRQNAKQTEGESHLTDALPLILYFPGNAGNRSGRVPYCQVFSHMNADVFLFDYRGYGDNAGKPTEAYLTADAQSVWQYAIEDRKVAPEQIVLYGESLGGGVATRLAADLCQSGTPPAALVLTSTFSSLPDAAADIYWFLPVRWLMIDRFESADRIADVTCPILILHGDEDEIISIDLGRKLFQAAPAESSTGIPKQFVPLPGAGHNDVIYDTGYEFRESIKGFFGGIGVLKSDK